MIARLIRNLAVPAQGLSLSPGRSVTTTDSMFQVAVTPNDGATFSPSFFNLFEGMGGT
jgi:hypothetical protein